MYNGNDLINQYCPQLVYPVILPTAVPNTFIVFYLIKNQINMGPYYAHI